MTDERMKWHMDNWADYCKCGRHVMGYPSRAVGLRSLSGPDFDEQVEEADKRCAEAVDAIVWDLPRTERESISARYLHSAWTLPPMVRPDVLASARSKIRAGLIKRSID